MHLLQRLGKPLSEWCGPSHFLVLSRWCLSDTWASASLCPQTWVTGTRKLHKHQNYPLCFGIECWHREVKAQRDRYRQTNRPKKGSICWNKGPMASCFYMVGLEADCTSTGLRNRLILGKRGSPGSLDKLTRRGHTYLFPEQELTCLRSLWVWHS